MGKELFSTVTFEPTWQGGVVRLKHETTTLGRQCSEDSESVYPRKTLTYLLRSLGLLALFIQFVGCAPLYVISETERTAVVDGGKAIVLLRIQCTIDNQPHETFVMPTFTSEPIVALAMGTFETVGEPTGYVTYRFLSEESREAGWTYFILSPGIYYLAVLGPDSSAKNYLHEAPRWRIDIPENTKLLYVGTLQLTGKSTGTLLFGGKIIKPANSDELILKNEHELASDLLSKYFPETGETKTILMQRWHQGDPIVIRSPIHGSKK